MENTDRFIIKSYERWRLGKLYFPNNTPDRAQRRLMECIRRYPGLSESLMETGFDFRKRIFIPVQVSLIVKALGTPLSYTEEP